MSKIIMFIVIGGGVAVAAVYFFILPQQSLTYDQAVSRLADLKKEVEWSENLVVRRAQVQLGKSQDLKTLLPEIDQFDLVIRPHVSNRDAMVEIFVSTEKSGRGSDGWMVAVAQAFNDQNIRLSGGKRAQVYIRKIASGTGYQFIASQKHVPDAFAPSNHLWIQMVAAHGIKMTPIREQLVGNIAGIVMKSAVADQLRATYQTLDIKNLIDAVVQGKLAMGYTNPFASSTGLNFLVTVLASFAEGQEKEMLAPEVVSSFESFQQGVPFVSLTTLQMRESVENDGSLDAFVMEYQTFINVPVLQSGYEFIPFGIPHQNPLYAVGDVNPEKMEVLEKLAAFAEQSEFQKLASENGFNLSPEYKPVFDLPAGELLVQAQKIWKEKKDSGKPISAVFLCDVSGSMAGSRIRALRESLLEGSEFIVPGNSIGLVLFSNVVNVVLPIKKFNLNHKAVFHAATQDMAAGGGTAMYDGIVVSLAMLVEEKRKNPHAKTMLFVLTDGDTNEGLELSDIRTTLAGLKIPIYTIGYESNLAVLKEVSSIVEAASINANEGEISYKIGSLLNAQM